MHRCSCMHTPMKPRMLSLYCGARPGTLKPGWPRSQIHFVGIKGCVPPPPSMPLYLLNHLHSLYLLHLTQMEFILFYL